MKQMLVIILTTCMGNISADIEEDINFIQSSLEIQASTDSESQSLEATQICQEPHLLPIYSKNCNAHHLREASKHLSHCEPRPTPLKIHKPRSKWPILITTIHRCAGTCMLDDLNVTCQQAAIESVTIPITLPTAYMPKVCQNASPPCSKICGKIQLLNHTQCKCAYGKKNNNYRESHSPVQTKLPANGHTERSTTNKQDPPSNPCELGFSLPAVAALALILLTTNVYLALKLKPHLPRMRQEDKEEPPPTYRVSSTGKETGEMTINWKFPQEESPENEISSYQTVRCPPVCLSQDCPKYSTIKCSSSQTTTHTGSEPEPNINSQEADNHSHLSGSNNSYEIMDFQNNQDLPPRINPQVALDDITSTHEQ